jgi:uncharacterized membrane protein HdeD (DUF308 family)
MSSSYKAVAKYAPWRRDIAWWVVLIQGLILAGIGLFALISESEAVVTLVYLLGIYALIHSIWVIVTSLRRPAESRSALQLVGAGIGLLASIVLVLNSYLTLIDPQPAVAVFAIGLLLQGLLNAVASLGIRQPSGFAWGVMVRGLIDILLGAYLIYALRSLAADAEGGVGLVRVIGWAGAIGGAALIIYAIVLWRNGRKAKEAPSASAPASATAAPTAPAAEAKPAATASSGQAGAGTTPPSA